MASGRAWSPSEILHITSFMDPAIQKLNWVDRLIWEDHTLRTRLGEMDDVIHSMARAYDYAVINQWSTQDARMFRYLLAMRTTLRNAIMDRAHFLRAENIDPKEIPVMDTLTMRRRHGHLSPGLTKAQTDHSRLPHKPVIHVDALFRYKTAMR